MILVMNNGPSIGAENHMLKVKKKFATNQVSVIAINCHQHFRHYLKCFQSLNPAYFQMSLSILSL